MVVLKAAKDVYFLALKKKNNISLALNVKMAYCIPLSP